MTTVSFKIAYEDIEDFALLGRFQRACPDASIRYMWGTDTKGWLHVEVPLWALKVCLIALAASSRRYQHTPVTRPYLIELERFLQQNRGTFHFDPN